MVRLKLWLAFAALGLVWGTTWVAAGLLAESVPPLRGASARFLLAALLCVPVILCKRLRVLRGRALALVLLFSLTMITLPFLLLLWARQHVPSETVIVLFAAMPLLLALLTPRAAPRVATQAAIVGLGATALAVGASFSVAQVRGAAVVLLAVASVGASAYFAHRELRTSHPVVVTALLLGAAAPLLFLASVTFER